jgi:hypothetical protein
MAGSGHKGRNEKENEKTTTFDSNVHVLNTLTLMEHAWPCGDNNTPLDFFLCAVKSYAGFVTTEKVPCHAILKF